MRQRMARFALVALVPTAVDVTLLVVLRLGLGWILVLADLTAIAVATVVSYVLHRSITFRRDSFVRWVQLPWVVLVVAAVAGAIDVVVLRVLFAASGFTTVAGLVGAKLVALGAAAVVRLVAYRYVLMREMRRTVGEPGPPMTSGEGAELSIVVPALDEAARIAATVDELREAGAIAGVRLEVVVVDDGSSDDTADVALRAGADQVVVLPANRGKGAAVRAGMLAARGDVLAFTDADLAYAPADVIAAARLVEQGWDVVVGDRRHPEATGRVGSNPLRSLGSRLVNLATYGVLLGSHRDTQCGLKVFRRDVARSLFARSRVDGFGFDVEVLHLIERDGRSLLTVPATARHSERSTVRLGRDTRRLLRDLWRVRHWSATGAYEAGAEALGDREGGSVVSGSHG